MKPETPTKIELRQELAALRAEMDTLNRVLVTCHNSETALRDVLLDLVDVVTQYEVREPRCPSHEDCPCLHRSASRALGRAREVLGEGK